ncbi:Uncharacterized [Syntrophomonas zehnderi OL-4]|uniref:Uncharacterized n=1 Tax=Syntrophomonas zehnderi OL-4 TaxID=690567 RepID=A0A0E4GDI2_9FIRM|nr:C39 family peptidase [Syntrophomonas zehnderi]CFY09787.1 Uncharacterized [Syntrophomonas zehnderi OL-4]
MIRRQLLGILLTSALIMVLMIPQSIANEKLVEPDGSVGGVFVKTIDGKNIMSYPISDSLKQFQEKKSKMAELHFQYKQGLVQKEEYLSKLKDLGASEDIIKAVSAALPFRNPSIKLNNIQPLASEQNVIIPFWQMIQDNSYYCGPATAAEIIRAKTFTSYSQSDLATPLHCTTQGTPWYDGVEGSGYPMEDTLNSYCNTNNYIPYGTTVTASGFQEKVIWDIDNNYGTAGDAYEVSGSNHLVGHPTNRTIYHWFAIYGYQNSGTDILYKDSVAGCSDISWSGNVPASSSMNYTTLAGIVNGRGIIW